MSPRFVTAEEALKPIRSGEHILLGGGAGEPRALVSALAERCETLSDVETLSLLTLGSPPFMAPRLEGRLRHNALFIGSGVRGAVNRGLADYTPVFLSEIPGLIRSGRIRVDAALIQVAPPEGGVASLGPSVDVVKAGVEAAAYVVAQVNPRSPWVLGDSFVKESDIDAFVAREEPLPTVAPAEAQAASLWIGRNVACLVEDGDTVQAGIGSVPDAVLASLSGKRDLGVHTEVLSDGFLGLIRRGAVTGRRKTLHPGKVVASICLGSEELYRALDRDPLYEFYPSDYVNDPAVIARNERLVAINSAIQVDLTGQVCADSIGARFYSGFGGQVDFIRGAARSQGGRSIIALPSTAKGGAVSRIVPVLLPGSGVVTTRADVEFVVTEYGIASLKGRTIRERAVALIQIAHPRHRPGLIEDAKKLGFLDAGHVLPVSERRYRAELELERPFGGAEVFFRPLKPTDLRRLKDLVYSQSPESNYKRFGIPLKSLGEKQFQELVAIDYRQSMAIGGFVREGGRQILAAVGSYNLNPDGRTAEAGFMVLDRYQGRGIGTFLLDYLVAIARDEGLEGFTAGVLADNAPMLKTFRRRFRALSCRSEPGWDLLGMSFSDWKGPPLSGARAAASSARGAARSGAAAPR